MCLRDTHPPGLLTQRPGFFYLYVEICLPADSKLGHCLHIPIPGPRWLLFCCLFSECLWQQPLCLDLKTALVLPERPSPRPAGVPVTFSSSSPALSPGAKEAPRVCRESLSRALPPRGSVPTRAAHARLFLVRSLSVLKEAARGVCVPEPPSSALNAPFCTCFCLSAAAL